MGPGDGVADDKGEEAREEGRPETIDESSSGQVLDSGTAGVIAVEGV